MELVSEDLVEGVYETKSLLLFRALVDLGCVSKVSSKMGKK